MAVLNLATEMAKDIESGVEKRNARTRVKKCEAIKREGSRIWEDKRSKGANGKRERPKGKKGRATSVKEKSLKKSENKREIGRAHV